MIKRLFLRSAELFLILLSLWLGFLYLAILYGIVPRRAQGGRKLLALDMSYTREMIEDRGLQAAFWAFKLGDYFEHCWTVHPFATVIPPSRPGTSLWGGVEQVSLGQQVEMIEGKIGRWAWLRRLPLLNFLWSQIGLFAFLLKLIRQQRISVIRASDPYYLGLLGLALARLEGIPILVRVAANYDRIAQDTGRPAMPRLFYRRWVEVLIQKLVFSQVDLIAAPVQDYLDFAVRNRAPAEKTMIFRYGNLLNPEHFSEPSSRRLGQAWLASEFPRLQQPFLISVGRLEKVKMVDHVVRALGRLKELGVECHALLIGDGTMQEELRQMAAELGVEDRLFFAGNRPQEWLAQIFPQAAVVVSPLTGRALSEAGLAGVPIVAYDLDWQKELVIQGQTGELVPAHDIEALAQAVAKILKNPEDAARLGRNVRAHAFAMMDPTALNAQEVQAYERLLEK